MNGLQPRRSGDVGARRGALAYSQVSLAQDKPEWGKWTTTGMDLVHEQELFERGAARHRRYPEPRAGWEEHGGVHPPPLQAEC